jgi:hypothetical protein
LQHFSIAGVWCPFDRPFTFSSVLFTRSIVVVECIDLLLFIIVVIIFGSPPAATRNAR